MTKHLQLKLYGALRDFGEIPSSELTDTRTLVTSIQRELSKKGRQFSLSSDRIARVDEALRNGPFGSIHGLREQMQAWHQNAEWGSQAVNEWYTEDRATAYHVHNQGSQAVLTNTAVRMSGLVAPFLLDLGCGSGLSSRACLDSGFSSFVVGLDLSEGMLRTAKKENRQCDWILTDISQPLPFRDGAFDGATSIGVLHYLLQDAEGNTSLERLQNLFRSIRCCVQPRSPVVFQFFPRREQQDANTIRNVARECGLLAELVCDSCYHSQSMRWFLWVCSPVAHDSQISSMEPPPAHACALFHPREALCFLGLVEWTRAGGLPLPSPSQEHADWLQNEHVKFARHLIRKLNNLENGQNNPRKRKIAEDDTKDSDEGVMSAQEVGIARLLQTKFGAKVSLKELKMTPFGELVEILHQVKIP